MWQRTITLSNLFVRRLTRYKSVHSHLYVAGCWTIVLAPDVCKIISTGLMFSTVPHPWYVYKYSSQCCEIKCSEIKCSVEQKLFIHSTFVHCSSWRKYHRIFCRKNLDCTMLTKAKIFNTIVKLHSTQSVVNKKKSRKRHVLTEWKLDETAIRSMPEEDIMSLSALVWVRRKYSSCWYKAAKLQLYKSHMHIAFCLLIVKKEPNTVDGFRNQYST